MRIFLSKCKNFFVVEIQELFPLTEPDIIKKKQGKASKKACERYQDLSQEEKNKKREYDHKQYNNFPEDEKQRKKIRV